MRQRQRNLSLPLFFWEGGTHISTEKMKVLVVRPMEMPEVQEIDHTLSAMQELVGGTIQAVYPFDDPVALSKNAESLRNSDALLCVAVPRHRGPAGLRDLFRFCRNCGLYALRSGPFRVCEARGGITLPSAHFTCC